MRHSPLRTAIAGAVAMVAIASASGVVAAPEQNNPGSAAENRTTKEDLLRQEIELRNVAQAKPGDPAPHIALAKLYLKLQNLPAAEAEARLARDDKGPTDEVDPPLAQALLQQNKLSELFRDVQPGSRENKSESQVRLALGLGHLALLELNQAEPLLKDAERLDETDAAPKAAMARLLLAQHNVAGAQKEIYAAGAITPDDAGVLLTTAQVLRAQGNTAAAMAKLDALIASYPGDVSALNSRADVLMSQNKLADAQKDIDVALKLAPKNNAVIFLDGVLLSRQGKLREADEMLANAGTNYGSFPYGYYVQGVIKYRLGQYEQAAAILSKYVARVPSAVVPRRLLARIALSKRDYAGAISELQPVLDANPADSASALLMAQAYLATGQRDKALQLYQRAAQADPNDPTAESNLARMEAQTGQVQQGIDELDKLAQTSEGAAVAGPPLVLTLLRAGRLSEAADEAQALVKRNGKDLVTQSLLGIVRLVQGNYAEAATILKNVVDKAPNLSAVQRDLAQAYIGLDKLDEAKAVLQGLLKQNPDSAQDAITLAHIELRQKNEAGAADVLRTAQQNAQKDPSPGIALLQMYAANKEWDKVNSYGRSLDGQFPANPAVIQTIASLRASAGDAKGAETEYAELVEALPDRPDALVRYAEFQIAANDKADARATLAKAVAMAPNNATYMQDLVGFDMAEHGADAAIVTARSFAKDEPELSELVVAGILVRAKRTAEAVTLITADQDKHPSAGYAAELGELLYLTGKADEAKQLLQSWLKTHDDIGPSLALANIYLENHNYDEAQVIYEKVHALAPNDVSVLNNLAWLYGKKHDPRARDYAAQAYRLSPGPVTADTLAWILVRSDESSEALSLLRDASASLPQNGGIQYHLAAALNATGQKGEARSVLEKLIQSGGTFDDRTDAQHLLDTLQHD